MPTTLPRISIVTPSYNQARWLPLTAASVLDQGYPNLEYLIQDGHSTDGTREVLVGLPPEVSWVSERDGGQADAVNRGWARATGEVLGWLNSDDVYEPGALMRVGEAFAADPGLDWLVGRCRIIDARGREIRRLVTRYKNFLLDHLSLPVLLMENAISQMAVFVRRRALDAVGPLRTDLHWVLDYDLWLRLMRRSRPLVSPHVLAAFRMYGGTKSVDGFARQFAEEHAVASAHAREAGLPFLIPLHRISAWKTVVAYRLVASVRPL
jgi:glycosyltransferase involved in cell wall biosynthesis